MGPGAVSIDERTRRAHAVDGVAPSVYCAPANPAQVAETVKMCAEAGAAMIPWGGGTTMRLGNAPRQLDVVLSMRRLNRLIEHDDANLTATMEAGATVAAVQEMLARRGQFLAFDPPQPTRATIGGVAAANVNGLRRMRYGAIRDQVVGMRVVLAGGEEVKAGGKVVKNVAGYDMCKLFVGSLGTLGVITQLTCRLAPLPEIAVTLTGGGMLDQVLEFIAPVVSSQLLPASIVLLNEQAASDAGLTGPRAAAVCVDGFEEAVQRHVADLSAMAVTAGLRREVLTADAHQSLWNRLRDFDAAPEEILLRLTVPSAALAPIITAIDRWAPATGSGRVLADAGTGVIQIAADGHTSPWPSWASLARERGGHAVLAAAPPALKAEIDVWGPAPTGLPLMREIKRQFDPHGVFSPGRFVNRL